MQRERVDFICLRQTMVKETAQVNCFPRLHTSVSRRLPKKTYSRSSRLNRGDSKDFADLT